MLLYFTDHRFYKFVFLNHILSKNTKEPTCILKYCYFKFWSVKYAHYRWSNGNKCKSSSFVKTYYLSKFQIICTFRSLGLSREASFHPPPRCFTFLNVAISLLWTRSNLKHKICLILIYFPFSVKLAHLQQTKTI